MIYSKIPKIEFFMILGSRIGIKVKFEKIDKSVKKMWKKEKKKEEKPQNNDIVLSDDLPGGIWKCPWSKGTSCFSGNPLRAPLTPAWG